MSTEIKTLGLEWIQQFSLSRQEPQWMQDLRVQAWELSQKLPLPRVEKTRIQRWNLEQFEPHTPAPRLNQPQELPEWIQQHIGLDRDHPTQNLIVQKDSSVVYSHLAQELQSKGVILCSLEEALRQHEDLVKEYFMQKAVRVDENRLTALHAALWSGGIFLYVPRNVEVELPIQSLMWSATAGAGLFPHALMILGDNSSLTYVDHYISSGHDRSTTLMGAVELIVGAGARVRFASVHLLDKNTTELTYRRAVVARDGHVEWILGEMNDGNTFAENHTVLEGTGANANSKLIAIGTGEQQANYQTRMQHAGQHTESEILSHGVTREFSWVVFNCITQIEENAKKANGQQSQSMLMLSDQSRGDANPILLIDEDDVMAGHAASVGQVNPEHLYYLMSRGIPEKEAERLIILGFLEPVVSRIPVPAIKEHLLSVIERKLQA